ncbi:MAG: pyrroline-5-carboxylate reductase [Planctomycetota bacterium]
MATIGFIGAGNMAQALLKGLIAVGLYKAEDVYVSDIRKDRLDFLVKEYGVTAADDNRALAEKVAVLVLSVKPQNMTEALAGIKGSVNANTLVISIAAGVRAARITESLGDLAVIRVMPNTPALIGEGASALFANEKAKPMLEKAKKIFSAVGEAVVVDEEDLIDAVTAISGSGPAYFFRVIEGLIKAGVKLGLSEEIAKKLVLQTAKGAALLVAGSNEKGETPADLRKKVTSPGGTTEAAMKVLEDGNKLDILLADATEAAKKRSEELSK